LTTDIGRKKPDFQLFTDVDDAGMLWDRAAPEDDIFLQRPYLRTLMAAPSLDMRLFFAVFFSDGAPCGVAVYQLLPFSGKVNYRENAAAHPGAGWSVRLLSRFKSWLASLFSFRVLVCGNMMVTGAHGFYFTPGRADAHRIAAWLEAGAQAIRRNLPVQPLVTLVKDVSLQQTGLPDALADMQYLQFNIQPNMVLSLPFDRFEAYLGAMNTKYRTRAKRAFKKLGTDLEIRELTRSEVEHWQPRMHALYRQVSEAAGFNMVALDKGYFAALKRALPEAYTVYGYFKGGDLVAFFGVIRNAHELDAHYLGYDKALNHERQLYLNMLYSIVQEGIRQGTPELVFSRTALEIKSSVGAVPEQMNCFVRHENKLVNCLGKGLFRFLTRGAAWEQRHPFKPGLPE
jgi:hypothetical protein